MKLVKFKHRNYDYNRKVDEQIEQETHQKMR